MTYEHRNAVIRSTFLGVEDHGIFTFNLMLDYGGSGQGAGNYTLQSAGHTAPNGFWLLRQIIAAAQADSWEALPGKHVVALIEGGLVRGLAPILTDGPPVIFSEVLEAAEKVTGPPGMSRPAATETDYRQALYEAQRALMYAVKRITPEDYSPTQAKIVTAALAEVNRVLDIGRDEAHEQIAT